MAVADKRTVFLVHGRDTEAKKSLEALLRAFDLRVMPWRRAAAWAGGGAPYTGDIVRAGMEHSGAVVVLLTPDDVAYLRPAFVTDADGPHEREPTGQPRMNVLFEAGMAMARDRERVVLVEVGRVRPMSDIDGVNVVRLTGDVGSRRDLAERLRAAGLEVDLEVDDEAWRTVGTFAREPLAPRDLTAAGGAPVAPRKEVDVLRAGRPASGPAGDAYRAFWTAFLERVRHDQRLSWVRAGVPRSDNWLTLQTRHGFAYVVSFGSGRRLRCELYIDTGDETANLAAFHALVARKAVIEREFGAALDWDEIEGKRACRVAAYASGAVLDVDDHPRYVEWFLDTASRLRAVMEPHVHEVGQLRR